MNPTDVNKVLNYLKLYEFNTLDIAVYFYFFHRNKGKSVWSLALKDNNVYYKYLRYFKILSNGTKTEKGMKLFKANAKNIQLTKKGRKFVGEL